MRPGESARRSGRRGRLDRHAPRCALIDPAPDQLLLRPGSGLSWSGIRRSSSASASRRTSSLSADRPGTTTFSRVVPARTASYESSASPPEMSRSSRFDAR